ncbi:MAG: hypothetical protein AB7I27_16055 [Bacteriovoracaceae bacterium]
MRYLNFLVLLILISCSSTGERHSIDESAAYRTSGVEQFFLPELPAWANSSTSGQCFKTDSLHYLDYSKLFGNYQLKYSEMAELQAQFNEKLEIYFRSASSKFLRPVEEASFFSNALEQVRGGVRLLKLPSVSEVDIVWIDPYISQNRIKELKDMAHSSRFDERLPILFSVCLSRHRMNEWIIANDLHEVGFYVISAEWLSPYNAKAELAPGLKLDLNQILGAGIKKNIILPTGVAAPGELVF